ncbi:hypothetical protein [Mycobacteroides abscessus]|uniref:Uncharacterized protein n=1 Tax=Mycobacteroides abscessus MAB_091912_2446 TaxID=1335414 RepID=A0A829MBA0_9MYCO|nr:hypothetical protein [Mycobacteroides abscessus]ESV58923.1 hypothetical protein L830_4775 [Mycobacteroides abscessus MAB_082312_2258]ESV62307.1 hypothetical protein L833_4712 [Mycobacteroides abscessus MAB_091912_2446]QSM04470.1 hypothetical protein PROPHIGD02-2_70 [Mycobacterium phage prophiGD02-2]QST87340.1 hypothetical protein PROPHIGD90-1_70 [Mycobacterium phage prophiGD90-1]AWG55559.1 hypothetical protein DDT53_15910 [Mycobacteroides abscessus]
MNVGELMTALSELDPTLPVVMEMTDEPPGDYEASEVRIESYCRERDSSPSSPYIWPTTWHEPEYAFNRCGPAQPVAYLSFNPPWKPTIDAEVDQTAIEASHD